MSKRCKYCKLYENGDINEKIISKKILPKHLYDSNILVWILPGKHSLGLWFDNGCNIELLAEKKIKFCPMCGRKLKDGD